VKKVGESNYDTDMLDILFIAVYIIVGEYFEHLGFLLALKKHKLLENGKILFLFFV